MFGRVIVLAAVVVALALLGSSFLLNRLPAPVPVSAAGATGAVAAEAPSPEPPQRESSGYREALLEADQRGQYAAGVLVNGVRCRCSSTRAQATSASPLRPPDGWDSVPREDASA